MSTLPASPFRMPALVSIVDAPSIRTQRLALPQASTSPPSAFQIRILTSATSDGSSTITWSQPTPVRRSAIARARASSIATAPSRASKMAKSLPRACILWNRVMSSRDLGSGGSKVHRRSGGGEGAAAAFELAPADPAPPKRRRHRLDHDEVHKLAVDEALADQQQRRKAPLAAVDPEGEPAAQQIDGDEQQPEERHPTEVGVGLGPAVLSDPAPSHHDAEHESQIDHRRHQGEQDLEQPGLRHADQSKAERPSLADRAAMLPQALQSAERPAESLPGEAAQSLRRLGPGNGVGIVGDPPAGALDGDGEVLVLGERVDRKAADRVERLPSPGADCSRNDHDRVEAGKRPPLQILGGDIFDRLPAGDEVDPV